jgi:signal transduction histidine kinase/CheY-like chemotaxis protein
MGQALKVIQFDSEEKLDGKKTSNKNNGSKLSPFLVPLRTAAIITAIIGIVSLVLEVRIYFQFRYEIYLARLFPTLFSLITLIFLQTKFGKRNYILLTHIYLFAILTSLSFVGFKIPSLYSYNLTAASLFILSLSLFLYWGKINQIIAASYFLILFGVSAFFSNQLILGGDSIFLLFTSTVLILAISIFASQIRDGSRKNSSRSSNPQKESTTAGENEEFDQSFINNSIIPLFQIKINGDFIYANSSLFEILDIANDDEFSELNFFDDFLKNEKIKKHFLKKIESKGRVENYRLTCSRKDGSEEILLMDCKSKRINDEIYLEGSLRNITLKYNKDKSILKELESLKQSKRVNSNIIPNFSDIEGKRSNVISKMGHALRTPMNSVLGFLTLIENGLFENEEELKEYSHSAKLSAESLLGLITDVVEIAKIQEGSVEIEKSEFNIREEIEKITSELTPHFKLNDLQFSYEIDENVPENVVADQSKYFQIIINLIRNAIQVTETGHIILSIVKVETKKGLQLVTSVEDSGKGLPEDELEKIIDKNYSVKAGDTKITANVLHIMICKELLTLLDGSISASSKIGIGTTFSFAIDLESNLKKETQSPINEPSQQVNYRSKPRLLLVEDNPISRKVEQKLLQEAGYAVNCVENGTDAIEQVEIGKYDLVLMDIELKDMNGLEATKLIRELPDGISNIPIIAVTAHSSMKDREKCLVAGMNDYISKPINITFLKMTIDQWLSAARAK